MPSRELYGRIKQEIDTIETVDAHEHNALTEEEYLQLHADFARFFTNYTIDDLESAGMIIPDRLEFQETGGKTLRVDGRELSLEEKWAYIKPWWENTRYTGYGRALIHSIRRLFNIDDLTDNTYVDISEKLAGLGKPGIYRKMLKDICGLKYSVNDVNFKLQPQAFKKIDRSLYHFIARTRQFTHTYLRTEREYLERTFNRTIRNLDDLLDTLDEQLDEWIQHGCLGLKIPYAYEHDLFFEDTSREDADRVMRRSFALKRILGEDEQISLDEGRPFKNYMVHRVLDRAERLGLPIIIHTGVQAGIGNSVTNSNAVALSNLFAKYPTVKFHLLHANYPYMKEAACLAKQFTNVTLDLTWVHIIVPAGAREGLSHFLDTVPVNKIHGFGGDVHFTECVYGTLEVARENIAHVLAEKVETGNMTETQAVETAHKLLQKNIMNILNIEG
ncbi:amidohydrolase family protein [Candidatus Omnitrophota bacterium]